MPQDEIVYTMRDFRGYPVSVPASKLDAWLAQQEELEKNPPPETPPYKLTPEDKAQIMQISEKRAARRQAAAERIEGEHYK